MATNERRSAERPLVVDEWHGGLGWITHPDERTRRTSHAVMGRDGVWLFDPLDAPGVDRLVTSLGDVVGVAVLSAGHGRDAATFADRFEVPVSVPAWIDDITTPPGVRRAAVTETLGDSGFALRPTTSRATGPEAIAWRETDSTLYTPDLLSTLPLYRVGDERIAPSLLTRLRPIRAIAADLDPDRIICGHGTGVFDDASGALHDALSAAHRGFPRALFETGPEQVRAYWDRASH